MQFETSPSVREFVLRNGYEVLLESKEGKPMLYVGYGKEDMEMYRGNYKISDYVEERYALYPSEITQNGLDKSYTIRFGEELNAHVSINANVLNISFESKNPKINRFWLRVKADEKEKCYGCGEQMSYFNLRGRAFPLWTSEPGVGRDKSTYVTWRSDVENKAGGDYYNTNYPQPTYVSSKCYYLDVDSTAYANFDFSNTSFHELHFWEVPSSIRIEFASNMEDLLEKMSGYFGRQPELPDWVYDGAILGVQGGTERAYNLVDRSMRNGIKVCGVWCQDWAGKRETSFGRRLMWDWRWNPQMYPNLPQKIEQYKEKGVRFLNYVTSFLANDGVLYAEAKEKGYFALAEDGGDYLVDFGEFYCGIVDLTNPDAFEWYKQCIIERLINFGADGWMADFGEYLPLDIKLHSGISPLIAHNQWPALWAKCNYEAVVEAGKLGEIMYFMRAGGKGSQKWGTMLWAGDQCVDFSRHDGLGTTIVGALSAGMSGCGLSHSDIGGYTSLFGNLRTKEVFLRWCEMAVFTPLMRTHEGNRPDENFQYYDDADTMEKFADMTDIHVMLKPYIKALVLENAMKGLPAQRPLFLHYGQEEEAWDIQTQYLFGRDLLVAPVLESEQTEWSVWLPKDNWANLWTGESFCGGRITVPATIGRAPAFYRVNSKYAPLMQQVCEKYGY